MYGERKKEEEEKKACGRGKQKLENFGAASDHGVVIRRKR